MAEEKFAGRPQIQKGDIVRVETDDKQSTTCQFVLSDKKWDEWLDCVPKVNINDVIAVYRFDGRDFKCIWESAEYQLNRFKEIIDVINKTQLTLSVKLKSVNEVMERFAKVKGDKASE